jgi:hypothetical protein
MAGFGKRDLRRNVSRSGSRATLAATALRCSFFGTSAGLVGMALDPDRWKNQDLGRCRALGGIHARAGSPQRCVRRKFNNNAHITLSCRYGFAR